MIIMLRKTMDIIMTGQYLMIKLQTAITKRSAFPLLDVANIDGAVILGNIMS